MRADDRLVLTDHVQPLQRGVTLSIALGFAYASIRVLGEDGGDSLGRALGALVVLVVLAMLVVAGSGTRTSVFDRTAGTVRTSFRVFGLDLFARVRPLADFTQIRTFHASAHRSWVFHILLVGPGRSLLVQRTLFAGPARVALASLVRWLRWPVDDEAGLLAPNAKPGANP